MDVLRRSSHHPDADLRWMQAALTFGRRGFGTTAPNPCVAAFVVHDNGVLLGRGVTAPGGRPHAEPLALAQAGPAARGATMFVTLEPCCHVGRGRPCVEAIIAAGIGRVVVACEDPDARVAGQGIAALRAAGIAVITGVGAVEARRAHRGHIHRVRDRRPAVTLKLAETADGYAASAEGEPRLMITGPVANDWVHVLRAMHDAVLIGRGTAQADDPRLTVRLPGVERPDALRIVLDRDGELDPSSQLAVTARDHPVLVLTGPSIQAERAVHLGSRGVGLTTLPLLPDGRLDLGAAMTAIAAVGVTRLFCEGGPRLGAALLDADLVDEVDLLTGPHPFGGTGRLALDQRARHLVTASGRFGLVEDRMLGNDRLRRFERRDACSPD